jgi:VanZ family protein
MLKKIIKFIPSIIWMFIIFYFSSRSTTGIGTNQVDRFLILKSFHLIEYAILAFLLLLAITKNKLAVIVGYLYAVSDEIHQYFIPGRTGRFRDTLIDLIGILIGIFIFNKIFPLIKRKIHLY